MRQAPIDAAWLPPPEAPQLGPDEVHVWLARLDVAPNALCELLDRTERERAERFHCAEDRRRFMVSHARLRGILGRYLRLTPSHIRFEAGAWGKPALARECAATDIRFNMSHSGELALYAVAAGREVGIDLEAMRSPFRWEDLAKRFFTPGEVAQLHALPDSDRSVAFFDLWTCKEAYTKATGQGLSLPLNRFEVSLSTRQVRSLSDDRPSNASPVRWTLRTLCPGAGYAAAVVFEGPDMKLNLWRWPTDGVARRA